MITAALIAFWLSVSLMLHSYVLYPLLLKLFSLGKKENTIVYGLSDNELPRLTIIFSAYNEQKVIREKLESLFNTTYPLSRIKVYIGSDNSVDDTNKIVTEFQSRYPQLFFFAYTDRNGKSKVLNRLVSEIQTANRNYRDDIFIFTDANVMFTPATFYELAKHFKNEKIALVGARILNKGVTAEGISLQEKTYIQGENKIKYLEGLNWGAMTGAFGACYAMRALYWTHIPENYLMEDFYLSMNVLKKGKMAISEPLAVCYEDVSTEVGQEYMRKSRIQAGNFQNLAVYWPMLFRFNAIAFCFFSHKFLRWMGPLLILTAYLSNIFLLNQSRYYIFTFVLQNILLLSPVIDFLMKRLGLQIAVLRFASYFYLMNLALVNGFLMYARGIKTNAWTPTKRNI